MSEKRIPEDDSSCVANPADVGVGLVQFLTGVHFENAISRNGDAGARNGLLNVANQLRMRFGERMEVKEKRLNDERLGINAHDDREDGGDPCANPPAARAAADQL